MKHLLYVSKSIHLSVLRIFVVLTRNWNDSQVPNSSNQSPNGLHFLFDLIGLSHWMLREAKRLLPIDLILGILYCLLSGGGKVERNFLGYFVIIGKPHQKTTRVQKGRCLDSLSWIYQQCRWSLVWDNAHLIKVCFGGASLDVFYCVHRDCVLDTVL